MAVKKYLTSTLRRNYNRILEKSFLIALIFLCFLFYAFPAFDSSPYALEKPNNIIDVVISPRTEQLKRPPRPDLPKIPVQSDDDDILPEVPIDFNQMQDNWLNNQKIKEPEGPSEIVEFIYVEEKPQLIRKVSPYYPELARVAGIEGTVLVIVLIGTDGNVESAEILKSVAMLDQAALDAALQFKFTPGKQRDKLVRVKMNIPFSFRLR